MPIAPLSEEDARNISSTLVLNDAISVVKELLDNALDSHATNIVIEISADTLNIIQIRDNGRGIGPEDRQLLCRRGCTSKIRTLDDLAQLGGTSLGFRGEALASIAQLSESVTFVTRVDGETAGSQLKFNSSGKLTSSSSASHGTGTTVRVSDFFKNIPVRKQSVQKQALKTLAGIKKLLLSYAFARPTVRLQFKVLKSKADYKENWSYAPCRDNNDLILLTSKVLGTNVAAQYKQETTSSEDGSYVIDALFPKDGADLSKSGGHNHFVSIDGRPLSVERGCMKEMHKIYSSYLQLILGDQPQRAKTQFFAIRLQCPNGAYDVNIEPAKDQVMLEDAERLFQLFEDLCRQVYGEKPAKEPKDKAKKSWERTSAVRGFDVLLAQKRPSTSHNDEKRMDSISPSQTPRLGKEASQVYHTKDSVADSGRNVHQTMYGHDDDVRQLNFEGAGRIDQEDFEEREDDADEIMHTEVTNPFTLAKMNVRLLPSSSTDYDTSPRQPAVHRVQDCQTTTRGQEIDSGISPSSKRLIPLPSPSTSPERDAPYQNPGPPNRPWRTRGQHADGDDLEFMQPLSSRMLHSPGPTLLDVWTGMGNSSSSAQTIVHSQETGFRLTTTPGIATPTCSQILLHSQKPPSASDSPSAYSLQSPIRSPLKTPMGNRAAVSPKHAHTSFLSPSPASLPQKPFSVPSRQFPTGSFRLSGTTSIANELEDIMEFEHRKRDHILQHRNKLANRSKSPSSHPQSLSLKQRPNSVPARPYKEGVAESSSEATTDYVSKFGSRSALSGVQPQPTSSFRVQNPHWNRYQKAVRELDRAATTVDPSEASVDKEDHVLAVKQNIVNSSKLSPNDPRAYLIRNLPKEGTDEGSSDLKRIRLVKMPFEILQPDLATYALVAVVDDVRVKDVECLAHTAEALKQVDPYVRFGGVEAAMQTVDQDTLQLWHKNLSMLIKGKGIAMSESPINEIEIADNADRLSTL